MTRQQEATLSPQVVAFLRQRRLGHLATVDRHDHPAVVPICYALIEVAEGWAIVSALDEKPKRVADNELARVRHIRRQPAVSLVVDDYSEDWRRLAFVQIRGEARLVEPGADGHTAAVAILRAKYPQYEAMAIERRPLIWIEPRATVFWQSAPGSNQTNEPRPDELAALIHGRRSVRWFQPRLVPRQLIEQAIAAAGWAPSPHGRQPWRFAVVEARARKEALAAAMAATWQAQLALDGQDAALIALRLAKSRQRLCEAPVLIVPCLYLADLDPYPDVDRQAAEATMAIQSLGAAIQNLLLTIYATGLDAGWMCAPLFCPEIVRDALGLDPALIPHAILTVGYAAKDSIRRPRMPVDRLIVSWE